MTTAAEWGEIMASDEPLHPDLEPFIEASPLGPMLKHPLVYSILPYPAMVNRQYAQKVAALAEAHAEGDWHSVIWLHERPYRLEALMGIADQMDDEDYWASVGNVWVDSENVWQNVDDWIEVFASPRPGREAMMNETDRVILAGLTEPITVFRGFTIDQNEDGLSWTIDRERAEWFARRFNHKGQGEVAQGVVSRADVVAYFTNRGEDEIVVADFMAVRVTEYLLNEEEEEL